MNQTPMSAIDIRDYLDEKFPELKLTVRSGNYETIRVQITYAMSFEVHPFESNKDILDLMVKKLLYETIGKLTVLSASIR